MNIQPVYVTRIAALVIAAYTLPHPSGIREVISRAMQFHRYIEHGE